MRKAVVLLFLLFLAACNGKSKAILIEKQPPTMKGETIDVIAENWAFNKNSYVVPAGEVTVNLKNSEGFHGIAVEGTDITIEGDGSYTTTLEPGKYKIVCNIICGTGHDDMIATLIVE